jgi:hypothetical protein
MAILQIFNDIGSDTKRSHKLALIEQHRNNALFMRVVKLALDPYVNFYIRKIPDYTFRFLEGEGDCHKSLEWALTELERLSTRELTGNAGIEHLRSVLSELDSDDAVVIERIIGKDLRCGMADGTVNAVVDGFIPTYPCLLARPYDAKNIRNIAYPAYSQLKADGLRVNFILNGSRVSTYGRSGRAIDLLGHMDSEIAELGAKFSGPVVFDCELVVVDENGKLLSRKVGNGIINKAIKGTISDEEAKMVRAQLWDVIPFAEFQAGRSKQIYKERFTALLNAIDSLLPTGEDATLAALVGNRMKYWAIPCKIVNNLDEAQAHFEELLSAGEEGTILKNMCGLWEDTRSKHLVKFKAEKDADLEVIGWNPGTGKFVDMVGSLICGSSDRLVEVSISGFSDDLRAEITRDIQSWLGGIVTVLYNERISSKDKNRAGVDSLFLPRFMERRLDKSVANSSKEIK